jgi:hypothetical protein
MKFFLEFIVILLSIGLPLYLIKDDFKKNILAIFFLLIYGSYVVWPLILIHELSLNHLLDIQVDNYIAKALFLDSLFLICFAIGYFFFLRKNKGTQGDAVEISPYVVIFLYWIFFSLVFLNNFLADIDLLGKWLGNSNQMTYGIKGLSYWLQNLLDSLIVITLLAYAININRAHLCMMLMGCIFFIVPFGFRYRLIFLLLGFLIIFVRNNQFQWKKVISMGLLLIAITMSTLFLGANRTAIVGQENKDFTFKLLNVKNLIIQTRGSYVDLAIYQGIDSGFIKHDYGKSFTYDLFVRVMPASFFSEGIKPYPPQLMRDVDHLINMNYFDDCKGCRTGEAQTIMGGLYYSFGSIGVCLAGILTSLLFRFYANHPANQLKFICGIATILAFFTFITRGYFPQFIDNLFYLTLPVIIIWLSAWLNVRIINSRQI